MRADLEKSGIWAPKSFPVPSRSFVLIKSFLMHIVQMLTEMPLKNVTKRGENASLVLFASSELINIYWPPKMFRVQAAEPNTQETWNLPSKETTF